MVLAKIIVKNEYQEKGDLVYRPLIRVLKEYGLNEIIEDDQAILLGMVQDGVFYELSTWKEIPYANYQIISRDEFSEIIDHLSVENLHMLRRIINSLIFHRGDDIPFSVSMIEDLARDRGIEFAAYNKDLTAINPYEEPYDGYNDFFYKCLVLKKKN